MFHFVEKQFIQFEQRMIEGRAITDLFRQFGQRQQFFEVGVAEADADFVLAAISMVGFTSGSTCRPRCTSRTPSFRVAGSTPETIGVRIGN